MTRLKPHNILTSMFACILAVMHGPYVLYFKSTRLSFTKKNIKKTPWFLNYQLLYSAINNQVCGEQG